MDVLDVVVIIAVLAFILIIYFIFLRNLIPVQSVSSTPSSTPSSASPSSTTSTSTITITPCSSTPYLPTVLSKYVRSKQYIVPLPASPFVVVVTPTTTNQLFSAYVSMNPSVDSTSIELIQPIAISETTTLVKSVDIADYVGYPYLIVNSSAPFTIYVSYPKIISSS